MSVLLRNVPSWWGCMLVAVFAVSTSQGAGESAPDDHDEPPAAAPVNLQVLPKALSGDDVRVLMKRYSKELGVSCSHCHVEDPQTQTIDYVSDDKPAKHTARVMIAMLRDINDKYLAPLGRDPRYSAPVTCGSCHQGQSTPPTFEVGEP